MPDARPLALRGPALTLVLGAAVAAAAAFVVAMDGAGVEGVRLAIRLTARTSFFLFLLAFTAAPLSRLFPGPFTRWQRANRRYLGLAFASSHAVHAAAIAAARARKRNARMLSYRSGRGLRGRTCPSRISALPSPSQRCA